MVNSTWWWRWSTASGLLGRLTQSTCHAASSGATLCLRMITFGLLLVTMMGGAEAALVEFNNCLGLNIIESNPIQLQWIPLFVSSIFDVDGPSHNLNITIYGNVSGSATTQLPPQNASDPGWGNSSVTLGKIANLSESNNKFSTLFTKFNVLSYEPYNSIGSQFCESTLNNTKLSACPIAPSFTNGSDLAQLPAFTISHDMYSSYAFTTISAVIRVYSGDAGAAPLACVSASITPDLGPTIANLLSYMPLLILVLVGIATASAAILSPWGTWDIFRCTSNYGRDPDQLRLITPGFGDCLQYLQFIVLSGSLSLNYPGFYQPVVSRLGWSSLLFNQSFVSRGPGMPAVVDGVYNASAEYGLDEMSQLVGMSSDDDMWAGMMIWLLVITAALVLIIQIGFGSRWVYRHLTNTREEDLQNKNVPFSIGNTIRVIFNYFLLPIVALSMYQLVIAGRSPGFAVGLAALTLIILLAFSAWLIRLIMTIKPRAYFFDDLPTVLLYGPLYNTYSDNSVTFMLVPIMLAFLRGIAIGAVQPSGVAQIVLLAICEVILILTLNAFRPFHSPTSMNALHTVFAVVRLLTILLMLAFIPSLGVDDAPRGWIGYVILLLHAITLFVGFFINALQTIVEVVARLAGAGVDEGGATRGGIVTVFGMRQLSRRLPRNGAKSRSSVASDAAMLQDMDQKSVQLGQRSRSMSANSAYLLNRPGDGRISGGIDSISNTGNSHIHNGSGGDPRTPTTPGGTSSFSYLPGASHSNGQSGGGIIGLRSEVADPYYRPPRPRRVTMELMSPNQELPSTANTRSRNSWTSSNWPRRESTHSMGDGSPDPAEGPSVSGRGTPLPAHLGNARERADSNPDEGRRSKTDYATREVDYYYGVRGPALSNMPTRRLKTGPADPTGPVSSATGWFMNLFGGKTKEKGKGFEVVRSARAPPQGAAPAADISLEDQTPYKDKPDAIVTSGIGGPRKFELEDEGDAVGGGTRHLPESSSSGDEDDDGDYSSDERGVNPARISQLPPSLPEFDLGGGLQMPSRLASKASSRFTQGNSRRKDKNAIPKVPRKSSKRVSSYGNTADMGLDNEKSRLSVVPASPPPTPGLSSNRALAPATSNPQRISSGLNVPSSPFHQRSYSNESGVSGLNVPSEPSHHRTYSGESGISAMTDDENLAPGSYHTRHSSSALGGLPPGFREERPSSLGYVQQHRASDSIHVVEPHEQHAISGSTAELVDDPLRPSPTPSPRLKSHESSI